MYGEVEATQTPGFVGLFHTADCELGGGVLLVLGHEARRLHEHTAGTARRVEDAAVERFDDFGEQADDAARCVELAAALALGHGEFAEEIFVDAPEGVVVQRGRNLGNLLQQFLEQGAGEQVEGLGQHAGELRVVLFDVTHRGIDLGANVGRFGQCQQIVEARLGAKVEDALRMVGGGFLDPIASPRRHASGVQLAALQGKAHFGKAQGDKAEEGARVFLRLEAGIGAELVGGVSQALFERGGGGVLFGGGDPVHGVSIDCFCGANG